MASLKSLLLAGSAVSLLVLAHQAEAAETGVAAPAAQQTAAEPATDASAAAAPATDPVAAAEKEVEDARAALRQAMATGKGIKEARAALAAAQKKLQEAQAAAGVTPAPPAAVGETPAPPAATGNEPAPPPAAVGETPPVDNTGKPAATGETPPAAATGDNPPAAQQTGAAPATDASAAAAPAIDPVAAAEKEVEDARAALRKAMATGKGIKEARAALDAAQKKLQEAQAAAGVTPAPPPAAGETPTPPAAAGVTPAPPAAVGKTAAPPAAVGETPPADGATPPAGNAKLPRLKPPKLPAGANPPPPPADATAAAPTGVTPPADTSGKTPAGTPPPLPLAIQLGPAAKGGEGVIGSQGDRVIIRDKGQITIRHDDDVRFGGGNAKAYVQKGSDGTTISTIGRPNGDQIITTRNAAGDIIRRVRKGPDGTVEVLIGDRGNGNAPPPAALQGGVDFDFLKRLPKLVVPIPQKDYIVRSNQASQQQIEQALIAPPVERVERSYSLEEIRRSDRLREKLRRIDVDTVNFEFGAATVPYDQVPLLEVIGGALSSIISRNSDEVFLIEGHTDAVGSDFANLALSDRRAESVAEILTTYYGIPPENLITQGYGEGYLKILTSLPERENRRVTVRRITPLLRAGG